MLRLLALLAVLLAAGTVHAQTPTPVFDEDDTPGDGAYAASEGGAVGDATLVLDGGRLPIAAGAAASGTDYGVLTYAHGDGGLWSILVGAPGFSALDLTEADSLVVFLNGPVGVPGVALPRLALQDVDGDRTAGLPLDFGTRVGFAPNESGFLDGSATDLDVSVGYVESLPADVARPGYPESIRLTFADEVVATSTASIGFPATPARFEVATEAGLDLPFRFVDTDEDGTLSADGEYVEVLTEDPASGSLRRTWRIEAQNAPASPPAAGDVYRLGVFNSGVDGDPGTWQRRAVAVKDFGPLGAVDASRIAGVVFENAMASTTERTLWIDAISALAYEGDPEGPAPPTMLAVDTGDRSVRLSWTPADGSLGVVVFRQPAAGGPYERVTPTPVRFDHWFDLDVANGEAVRYVLRSTASNGIGPRIQGPDSDPVEATPEAGAPDVYIEDTERRAFDFFWEQANPANGLVKDRSTEGSAASIASVGFGLSAITVAVDRGWITRAEGVERTLSTLDFFATCPQSDASSGVCGYRGFFYHFLDMQTGLRRGTTELSTIDTALLLGGVLHAARYYDGAGAEADIRARADQIWRRVEWDWAANRPPLVTLGWKPEAGQGGFAICNGGLCDWNGYNEAMILYVLGLGSPTHPLPDDAWDAWTAGYGGQWQTQYGYTFLTFPPLFGHQYSHTWIDFRNMQDDYMREKGITYVENSRRATLASPRLRHRQPGRLPELLGRGVGADGRRRPVRLPRPRGAAGPERQRHDHANGRGRLVRLHAGPLARGAPHVLRPLLRRPLGRLRPQGRLQRRGGVVRDRLPRHRPGADRAHDRERADGRHLGVVHDPPGRPRRAGAAPGSTSRPWPRSPSRSPRRPPSTFPRRTPPPAPSASVCRWPRPARPGSTVHDALGRRVAVVADGPLAAGAHALTWDASAVAAGVYVVRLEAAGLVRTRTVVVTR